MKFNILYIVLISFTLLQAEDTKVVAGKCMACHKELTAGLYQQWLNSSHARQKVTCLECHGAKKGEPGAFQHHNAYITTLVTPKDCGTCHAKESQQVQNSHHATAGLILESNDAYMAHVAGGLPVAITGCESCHGAQVRIDARSTNRLSKQSWPNSGIGRLNPDGSKGSCNACHTRHSFSVAQARQPESCSKCHLGPDHPQKEVYEESKHGNAYYTHIDHMNLNSRQWIVGQDYYEAPTCATCHMSATKQQKFNHNVGDRIAWTLRPAVSVYTGEWQSKRENMKEVCSACHGKAFVDGHFYQYDAGVRLYNDKFARPAAQIMDLIVKNNLLQSPAKFSNKIEWTYWELWHHEGRRARHGMSMMGPDYTWWHGIYEVAQHFYFKLIPEAREYNNAQVNAFIDDLLHNDPMHKWLNTSTEELKTAIRTGQLQKIYEKMFSGK